MGNGLKISLVCLILLLVSCGQDDVTGPDDGNNDQLVGTVEFTFPIVSLTVPVSGIHRIDLSLASSAYDLYRGDFIVSANVTDQDPVYSFTLEPGEYYYQAGITCTCLGDTCLWGNFPGGRLGTKWTMGTITIVKEEKLEKTITFNK